MRTITMSFFIDDAPDAIYTIIADLASYQKYADAVNKVEISEIGENSCESAWEVKFRDGLLRWIEQDQFFPARHRIEFHQTKGDLAVFEGSWQVETHAAYGAQLYFTATLDLGLPQLEKLLEPIAEQALRENIASIVSGLFQSSLIDNSGLESESMRTADNLA